MICIPRFGRATVKPFPEKLSTLSISPQGKPHVSVEEPMERLCPFGQLRQSSFFQSLGEAVE